MEATVLNLPLIEKHEEISEKRARLSLNRAGSTKSASSLFGKTGLKEARLKKTVTCNYLSGIFVRIGKTSNCKLSVLSVP